MSMRVSFVHLSTWPVPVHGVASLATVVRDAGHAVQIVDLTFCARGRFERARRELDAFRPQVVCLSIFDDLAREIARWVRGALPGARILFGGSYPTLFPEEVLADPVVDGVCIGDGEEAQAAGGGAARWPPPAGRPRPPARPRLEPVGRPALP